MRTLLFYRPNSENERQALDYMRDLAAQTGKKITAMDPDSPAGAELCRLYDIMQFPAILVTDDDGALQNLWLAQNLPTFSEISYYIDDTALGEKTLKSPKPLSL